MTDQELELTLKSALEHAAPDNIAGVLSRCGAQEAPEKAPKKRSARRFVPWLAAACLALLVTGGMLVQQANAVASVISLDVNPSIELQVNSSERVLRCLALNQEAQDILGGMDLTGTQLDVAVNAIIGSLVQNGYLDSLSSAILISVEDNDTQRGTRLQQDLTSQVDTALQNASANAAILSQTFTQDASLETQARENNISVGKAALIQAVQALNSSLTFEDLSTLNVEELEQLRESGAPGLPIGTNAAANAAQEYAGVLEVSAVVWEVDPELDEYTPHYEVELETQWGEFEYKVDAYTGEILSGPADIMALAPSSNGSSTGTSSNTNTGTTNNSTSNQPIGSEAARSIAFSHAGVDASQIRKLEVEEEHDDGRYFYKVEFKSGQTEYEYEIDAYTGDIISAEQGYDD